MHDSRPVANDRVTWIWDPDPDPRIPSSAASGTGVGSVPTDHRDLGDREHTTHNNSREEKKKENNRGLREGRRSIVNLCYFFLGLLIIY
jgi:hypothetical protein